MQFVTAEMLAGFLDEIFNGLDINCLQAGGIFGIAMDYFIHRNFIRKSGRNSNLVPGKIFWYDKEIVSP